MKTKEDVALEFFTQNVTYLEEEQARKMATENRSLTYRAVIHGWDAATKETDAHWFNHVEEIASKNQKLQSRVQQLEYWLTRMTTKSNFACMPIRGDKTIPVNLRALEELYDIQCEAEKALGPSNE